VDYGFLGLWVDPFTGVRRAVQAFAMILSHSRHIYSRAVVRMDQQAWAESHVAAFTLLPFSLPGLWRAVARKELDESNGQAYYVLVRFNDHLELLPWKRQERRIGSRGSQAHQATTWQMKPPHTWACWWTRRADACRMLREDQRALRVRGAEPVIFR
jgi:hypothetical protein